MDKSPEAFRTISEVAEDIGLPQHVLRFWETRFPQIKPLKRGGGRRYYRRDDIALLKSIRALLYGEGYTIRGVQRLLREQGARAVATMSHDAALDRPLADAGDGMPPVTLDAGRPLAPPLDLTGDGEPSSGDRTMPREWAAALRHALGELAECARILEAARRSLPQ